MPRRAPISVPGIAKSASRKTLSFTKPVAACRVSAAPSTVPLKIWNKPRRPANRRRQDVKPDPQRHQRRAETGQSGHETTGERAGEQNRVGGKVHYCLLFLIIAATFTRRGGQVLSQSKPSTITRWKR